MKTSEFISKVERLGYQIKACRFWIDVFNDLELEGTVFTKEFKLSLSSNDINLIKIFLEYTETPIEERKDEKKYIAIVPDPEIQLPYVRLLRKNDEDKVYISCESEDLIAIDPKHHLTEAEIRRNHEYLWQFAKEVKE